MFSVEGWDRNARIVELFCGSGPQLQVLDSMGFPNLEGVDLSANLLELYEGRGRCYVADCRELPFEDAVRAGKGLSLARAPLTSMPRDPV